MAGEGTKMEKKRTRKDEFLYSLLPRPRWRGRRRRKGAPSRSAGAPCAAFLGTRRSHKERDVQRRAREQTAQCLCSLLFQRDAKKREEMMELCLLDDERGRSFFFFFSSIAPRQSLSSSSSSLRSLFCVRACLCVALFDITQRARSCLSP